jgi:hypothetical protein
MDEDLLFDVLTDGSLVVTVGEGCIRTAAARAHRELAQLLLDERASDENLERALDILTEFLNTADFPRLRATYPELAGGMPCRVRVYRDRDKTVKWAFEGSSTKIHR